MRRQNYGGGVGRAFALAVCAGGAAGVVCAGPAIVTSEWSSAASGDWAEASNWSSAPFAPNNGVPDGSLYHAVIGAAGKPYTVGSTAALALQSLVMESADATLHLAGPSLTLHESSSVAAGELWFAAGELLGAGDLTVSGHLRFMGGQLRGEGGLVIAEQGRMTIESTGSKRIERRVENAGYMLWNSRYSLSVDGADIVNQGLFEASFEEYDGRATTGPTYPQSVFSNAGTFLKSGSGDVEFDVRLDNDGFVFASQGRLELEGGGVHTGEFLIGAGAILDLRGGHDLMEGSIVHGAGELRLFGYQNEHFGATDVEVMSVYGGTTDFHAAAAVRTLRVLGGDAIFHQGLSLVEGSALTVTSGTFDGGASGSAFATGAISGGVVTGDADLTFATALGWTGGRMSGAGRTIIEDGATLTLNGGAGKLLHRSMENRGDAVWTVGLLRLTDAAFINEGLFTANSGAGLLTSWGDGGVNVFDNRGEFVKVGAGTAQFIVDLVGVRFENSGMVDVRQGTLRLAGSGAAENEGVYRAANAGAIEVVGDFTNGSQGALEFEVGGMKERGLSGLMTITGEASLAGTLSVSTPEAFSASWGDRWVVMSYGSVDGDFDVFELPTSGFASRSDEFGASDLRWYAERGETEYAVGVSHIADIDHDGLIGFADLNVIASNFNAFGSWAQGDVDGDGFVGFTDLNVVLSLFNVAAPRSVPGPGATALLACAGVLVGRRRRGT